MSIADTTYKLPTWHTTWRKVAETLGHEDFYLFETADPIQRAKWNVGLIVYTKTEPIVFLKEPRGVFPSETLITKLMLISHVK